MANRVAGFQKITGLDAVKSLTVPAGARECRINAEGQNVRYRLDGSDPAADSGNLLTTTADEPLKLTIDGGMHAAKFIEVSASATLSVHYFY